MKIIKDSMLKVIGTDQEINKIKSDNTYGNPEFRQANKMNRSTVGIKKFIHSYEMVDDKTIIVPRGYYSELPEHELVDDTTTSKSHLPSLTDITLRDYQDSAVNEVLRHDQGILQSGTGSGKTLMGLSLIVERQQKTIILTHSKLLMKQWVAEIKKHMGFNAGFIGDGKEIIADITVCMLQTLNKRPKSLEVLSENFGLVMVDECHHIPSKTFATVINQLACKYRYGLTATPHRRDGLHQLIQRHIGPIVHIVPDRAIHAVGGVVPVLIKQFNTGCNFFAKNWNEYLCQITKSNNRNKFIINLANQSVEKGYNTLILTDRVEHAELLSNLNDNSLLIHGQLPAKIRRERMAEIHSHKLTIGTTGLLGEGLDVSAWTSLILATPISSKVKLLQAVGRVMRNHEGKSMGFVADLVDEGGFSRGSFKKRRAIYKEKQFQLVA